MHSYGVSVGLIFSIGIIISRSLILVSYTHPAMFTCRLPG